MQRMRKHLVDVHSGGYARILFGILALLATWATYVFFHVHTMLRITAYNFGNSDGKTQIKRLGALTYLEKENSTNMTYIYSKEIRYNSDNFTNISKYTGSTKGIITGQPTKSATDSEIRHIAFLKVHKCGSTTVLNIMYRFGVMRNLNYILPIFSNYVDLRPSRRMISLVPPPLNGHYDILCNHVILFNPSFIARLLPPDTKYIAIVREPFERLRSSFNYYRNVWKVPFLSAVKGKDPFLTYTLGAAEYESKWGKRSVTNNKMAMDFGFSLNNYRNVSKFQSYLEEIDDVFDLVMVAELFHESLVVMRRMLKWTVKDIIFIPINVRAHSVRNNERIRLDLHPFLVLDEILYDHFRKKLEKKIAYGGQEFQDEVVNFKAITQKVEIFCNARFNISQKPTEILSLDPSQWNDAFNVKQSDCSLLMKEERSFLDLIRKKQIKRIQTFGANLEHLL